MFTLTYPQKHSQMLQRQPLEYQLGGYSIAVKKEKQIKDPWFNHLN